MDESSGQYMQLDPKGDVVLIVKSEASDTVIKFLVSSKILDVAFPVFAKLFESRFKEGAAAVWKSQNTSSPGRPRGDDDNISCDPFPRPTGRDVL